MRKLLLIVAALAAYGQVQLTPQRLFIESAKDGVITAHLAADQGRDYGYGPTFTAECESHTIDYVDPGFYRGLKDCHLAENYIGQEIGPADIGHDLDGKIRCATKFGLVVLMQEKSGVWFVENYKITSQ